jgi:serine/threonine-protein kinase
VVLRLRLGLPGHAGGAIIGGGYNPHGPQLSAAVLARLRDALKDRYLVERELGEGGAATVYLARDLRHDRNVAIKVFRPDLAETLGVDRFTREIRTAANLNHPHILTVLDSGTADGLLYYVMPFAEGESLRARVAREGGLPVPDAVRIMREVADALAAAHAAGVVHRDIKPDNVLISGRHALVADFGVAKAISESTGRNDITTLGVALGTPAYMAPEQAAADPHVDHRADIYALGVMGYEMLVGEPPFMRRTPQEVLAAHLTETPPLVSSRRPSVPPALDALIAKCLAKQPGDRFQSALEVETALESVMTPTGGTSPAAGLPPTTATLAVSTSRASRAALVAAAAVIVIAGSWFGVSRLRGSATTDDAVVAVLPFDYSGTPDLAYLREGIVNVLEANLTGEGGPRAVASQTIIAQWRRRGGDTDGLTEDEARALAREVGAGQILRGGIVAAGSEIVVSATLLPVSGTRQPVQAQVKGPADSIAALATQLAGQLLSLRVGEAKDRLAALQSVPPAALRAYLVGQQQLRASRFLEAHQSLSTALGLDSTFALAAMALATAQSWSPINFGAGDVIDVAYRHREKLGPRDSIILHMRLPATFAGRPLSLRESMDLRERMVQQVPDRPEGWYLIGDIYFHRGSAMGISKEEALRRADNAFRRVLALDPDLSYIKLHLAQIHMGAASLDRMKQVADSLGLRAPEIDVTAAVMSGDSSDVSRYQDQFRGLNPDELAMISWFTAGTSVGDFAYEQALARSTTADQRSRLVESTRDGYWMQGRPLRARREHQRLQELGGTPASLLTYPVVLAALFDDGDSVLADQVVAAAVARLRLGSAQPEPTLFGHRSGSLVIGLWSAHVGDTTTLRHALARLDAIGGRQDTLPQAATARLYADALRLVSSSGEPDRGMLERFDGVMRQGPALPAPVVVTRSALNLVAARSWERLGEMRRAAMAAERAATWEPTPLVQFSALRDVGRTKLAAGDTTGAIAAWKDFLFYRNRAEPAQRQADDEIRAKLAELERARK